MSSCLGAQQLTLKVSSPLAGDKEACQAGLCGTPPSSPSPPCDTGSSRFIGGRACSHERKKASPQREPATDSLLTCSKHYDTGRRNGLQGIDKRHAEFDTGTSMPITPNCEDVHISKYLPTPYFHCNLFGLYSHVSNYITR